MTTERILFVDDDPMILSGFRRLLRRNAKEWSLEFATNAADAIERLEQFDATIIVSDMRMPGRDGASLLDEVQHKYPSIVRFVLSGEASSEAVMRATSVSHQFLAKPCAAEDLVDAIRRTSHIRSLVSSPELAEQITGLGGAPSLPETYNELRRELGDREPDLAHVSTLIGSDLAMSAEIMKLVNSSYFGAHREIQDVEHAVSYLGLGTLSELVLGYGTFSALEADPKQIAILKTVMSKARHAGRVAQVIADTEDFDHSVACYAWLIGMLGYLGEALVATQYPQQYAQVVKQRNTDMAQAHQAEQALVGSRFDLLGAYLMGLWSLPYVVVEAVAYRSVPGAAPLPASPAMALSHAAFCLTEFSTAGDGAQCSEDFADTDFLQSMGLADRWDAWREALDARAAA